MFSNVTSKWKGFWRRLWLGNGAQAKGRESIHTFREFYPEGGLRFKIHYAFAHKFLPQYVWQNPHAFFSYLYADDMPGGPMEPTRFIQSRWSAIFEKAVGVTSQDSREFRRVSDLSMSIQELDGRPSALVQMPTPEGSVQAFFVCIVLLARELAAVSWRTDVEARVFTLEMKEQQHSGDKAVGVICEWTSDGTHQNSGYVIPAERDLFLRGVAALLAPPE
jgi:hypothetical protein